jgi:hypothetical protein
MIWCTAGLAILLPTVGLTLIGVYLCGLLRDLRRGPSESTGLKAFDRKQEKTHPHS